MAKGCSGGVSDGLQDGLGCCPHRRWCSQPYLGMLSASWGAVHSFTWAAQKPRPISSNRRSRVFQSIQSKPQTPNKVGDHSPWHAAHSDCRVMSFAPRESSEVVAPAFRVSPWLVISAPIPSRLVLFTVSIKPGLGFIFVHSSLLGGKPVGNRHGGSVLINGAGLNIRLTQLCSMLRMITV